jgi:hypothetical protein
MSPSSTTKNSRYENDKKNVHKDNSNKISPSRSSPPGFRQNLHTSRWSGSILPKNLACLNAPFLFAFYCSKRWFTFSFSFQCFFALAGFAENKHPINHLFIVLFMCTFSLKSYNPKEEIRNPHFFILNKGNNSGKPLITPCPNCFSIRFQSEVDKEQLYWLMYSLWQSKAFYPYLRGSVIPFVVLRDMKKCILEGFEKAEANPAQFNKAVEALRNLEAMEKKCRQNLKMIQLAKISVFRII